MQKEELTTKELLQLMRKTALEAKCMLQSVNQEWYYHCMYSDYDSSMDSNFKLRNKMSWRVDALAEMVDDIDEKLKSY